MGQATASFSFSKSTKTGRRPVGVNGLDPLASRRLLLANEILRGVSSEQRPLGDLDSLSAAHRTLVCKQAGHRPVGGDPRMDGRPAVFTDRADPLIYQVRMASAVVAALDK